MNRQRIDEMIAASKFSAVEDAWMNAAQEGVPPRELASVLEALVAASQAELAQTLAWAFLAEKAESLEPAKMLELAKALVLAVPQSDDLRKQTADLYRKVHGTHAQFETLMTTSGLLGGQSPRRAVQTLDICLAVQPGCYLANRFDGHVLKASGFNEIMGEYELSAAGGTVQRIGPKNLADEFEVVSEQDFRVLCQHRPEELGKVLQEDPSALLVGVCMTHGGQIDAISLKEMLVPRYLQAGQWSDWWSKARTAIKRCPNLGLEGRSPVVIRYHAGGLTLEKELASTVAAAKTPVEKLAALTQYVREARSRKTPIDGAFAGSLVEGLAQQAHQFKDKRPADALAATLALQAAKDLGLAGPKDAVPAPHEILAGAQHPATVVADLANTTLWSAALEVLKAHPLAPSECLKLLPTCPAGCLDDIAACLDAQAQGPEVEQAASAAFADPVNHLDLFVWLWKGPAKPPANIPSKIELLTRMLNTLIEIEHDWSIAPSLRKEVNGALRAALASSDYGAYRAALAAMDEAVAGTIKRQVERAGGLSDAVRGNMMDLLRESFFGLFVKAKIIPWLDENAIYTTEAALQRREAELKDIVDVRMMANARAIGAAAAHGDLSENSEWKFALEERDMLRARAAKLQNELALARTIHPETIPTDSVGIGSAVVLKPAAGGPELRLTFLGPWESDVTKNVFSYQTAMAQDMMGKIVGDTVDLKMEGLEGTYTIERIEAGM